MTLIDFRPRWRVGRRLRCSMFIALSPVVDVLSSVPMALRSLCRRKRSVSASALHFAWRPLRPSHCMVLHTAAHVHARFGVPSPVQTACPERAMPAAWWAFAGRQAAPCAAPPGHRIPVLSGREKMQGKIKGRGTTLREMSVCTWGWRGTHLIAAPCRVVSQSLVSLEPSACFSRLATLVLDGAAI